MHDRRLNLSALRALKPLRRKFRSTAPPAPDAPETTSLSRRDLFGLAAITGLTLPPAVGLAESLLAGYTDSFAVTGAERRIVFRLHGHDRWIIDCDRFGGRPRLIAQKNPHLIRVALLDAQFPGTLLPADFDCDIYRSGLNWRMDIRFRWGGFHSRVSFVRWLAQREPAAGTFTLIGPVCSLAQEEVLELAGLAEGAFGPDWTFRLKGPRIARIDSATTHVTSDAFTLTLLNPGTNSLLERPAARRSLLTLERGTAPWRFSPPVECGTHGDLTCPENSFSSLRVETWEGDNGETGTAILALSDFSNPSPVFETSGTGPIRLSEPVRLPLTEARYARTAQWPGGPSQQVFLARFSEDPTWLTVNGCRLAVGARFETALFELIQDGTDPAAIRCEPGLRHAHVPLAGAITQPMELPYGARLQLVQTAPLRKAPPVLRDPALSTTPKAQPAPPAQQLPPGSVLESPAKTAEAVAQLCATDFRCLLHIPGPAAVTVLRPDDLLHLKFEFRNLTLQVAQGQPPQLVRVPGQLAYLVVYFPPQHIAEEAFREPRESPNLPKPIRALISGWSQLVFEIPPAINTIPYTLPALLDWSQFQLVTAPAAAPPPPPPSTRLLKTFPGRLSSPFLKPQSLPDQHSPKPSLREAKSTTEPLERSRTIFARARARALPVADIHSVLPRQIAQGIMERAPNLRVFATPTPPTREQIRNVTAIEAPFRLFMSPSPMAGWVHPTADKPILRNGRQEVWHTRLGVRRQLQDGRWIVDESDDWYRTLRAIWSPDYVPPPAPPAPEYCPQPHPPNPQNPFRMSLDARNRHELVQVMADATRDTATWPSRVARADHFMLSALGAWMKLRYAGSLVCPANLVEWEHIANMGRDQYVKVAEEGYLYPFGHRAALVTITERKFDDVLVKPGESRTLALLRQRQFLVVREPVKQYPEADPHLRTIGQATTPSKGRNFPYRVLRITTLVTPDIEDTKLAPSMITGDAFWPIPIGTGTPFRFQLTGEDIGGRTTTFSASMIFIKASAAVCGAAGTSCEAGPPSPAGDPVSTLTLVMERYRSTAPFGRQNDASLHGQKIAFVPPSRDEDYVLETSVLTFDAELASNPIPLIQAKHVFFFPIVAAAQVRIPAVQRLLGHDSPIAIKYAAPYVQSEFDPAKNVGEVFAELLQPVLLGFQPDKVGGLASPNIDITGLSRKTGPFGWPLQSIASGQFDPGQFFKKAQNLKDPQQLLGQAQILGGIFLGDIIGSVLGALPPQFVTESLPPDSPETVRVIKTSYKLDTTNLKSDPLHIFQPLNQARLTITSQVVARIPKPGAQLQEPEFTALGSLVNFEINLFAFLILTFKELRFVKLPGRKLDVTADLADDPLRFGGPLEFVNALRKFIPAQGFKDPPSLDITPSGITAGYSLALPNIAMGVFSFENIKLGAGLSIPFTNSPVSVRFAFSTRKDPFNVVVSLFGGGGFFGLELDTRGIRTVEAAIEFGGKISLDLAVAKGTVVVMAGIYFKVSRKEDPQGRTISAVQLEGYVRAGGALSVLALITVSLELRLSLSYLDDGSRSVWGRATLVIKVEIAFFSKSVEVEFEKRFAGSSSTAALEPNPYVRPVSYSHAHRIQFKPATPAPSMRLAPVAPLISQPAKIADLLSAEDWNRYAAAFA